VDLLPAIEDFNGGESNGWLGGWQNNRSPLEFPSVLAVNVFL
jgi:hypothetical protein